MPSTQLKTIFQKLQGHKPPLDASAEGWCYDQLLGAAFALEKASKIGSTDPEAFKCYRSNVSNLYSEDTEAYKGFGWGFYLNSAIHRIVWGCERLLRFVGKTDNHKIYFPEVVKKAREKADKGSALHNVLAHFQKNKNDELKNDNCVYEHQPVTKDNVLHILRGRVNRQKHWVSKTDKMSTRGNLGEGNFWNDTSADVQHSLAIHALSLLIDLYWETVRRTRNNRVRSKAPVKAGKE